MIEESIFVNQCRLGKFWKWRNPNHGTGKDKLVGNYYVEFDKNYKAPNF